MDKKHGYINTYINAQRRRDALDLVKSELDVESLLEQFSVDGYRVAFSFDERNSAMRVTVTTANPDSPNKNYILSEFARGALEAFAFVYYYHYEMCGGGDWMTQSTGFSAFKEFEEEYKEK